MNIVEFEVLESYVSYYHVENTADRFYDYVFNELQGEECFMIRG